MTQPKPTRKRRVFSGMQPTGEAHLGNYLGALRRWVQMQDEFECLWCIVDDHAITGGGDPKELPRKIVDLAVSFLAVAPTQYQAKGGKIEVHLDSPTGALLGESEPIRPTAEQAPVRLGVPLRPTAGLHDVYFVFGNPDAKGDGFMFGVLTATFEAAPK